MLKGARALGAVAFDLAPQAIGTGDVNPMTFLFHARGRQSSGVKGGSAPFMIFPYTSANKNRGQ